MSPWDVRVLPAFNTVTLAAAAATYADMGVPVHPLRAGSKLPATRHGVQDATTDLDRIDRWWARHPDHNIGLACGHVFDVVDVDVKAGQPGAESLRRLVAAGHTRGAVAVQDTPTGGWHLLFPPAGIGCPARMRAAGIDYRGRGGYIVGAPSSTEHGTYTWSRVRPDVDAQPFPYDAAAALLAPPVKAPPRPSGDAGTGDIAALVRFVEGLTEGNRNAGLFWAAATAAGNGHDPEQLRPAALSIGLDDLEVTTTLRSAQRKALSA